MLEFTFNLDPASFDRSLTAFQLALADQSPALAEIADDFREMITEQFASEGRAGGEPWAPLAPSTLRRGRPPGSSILVSSGTLLRSLRDAGAVGHLEESDGQTLTIGSSLPYALFHQTGTGLGFGQSRLPSLLQRGRGMPMRPIIVLTPARREHWLELMQKQVEASLAGHFLLGPAELASA